MQIANEKSKEAFKKLFDFYYPKIIGYGIKGGLSKEQAADMAQEVMLKIWKNAQLYNNEKGNINTWVYAIVRNQKYDMLRKQSRDPLSIIGADDIFDDEHLLQQEDEDYNSEDIYHLAYTKEMITKLSSEQQEVLNGVYQQGLTQKEYADQEKLPLGTVKSRIRLAIKNLKIILEEK
ncbi:sigma-70 family RNA polymerase sigma factor [Halobacteriovorax sp. XZX-3]|uniref:sigma-70 family RNA polymerase sigma factor n=1 Tax=unclassified Halobacteriovorax TaxID=2639665 RepID=UPI001304A40B|nr:sigma-70 family RNA polymerase sigma factor [Halobacteriovorax sp. DA5]